MDKWFTGLAKIDNIEIDGKEIDVNCGVFAIFEYVDEVGGYQINDDPVDIQLEIINKEDQNYSNDIIRKVEDMVAAEELEFERVEIDEY